VTDPEFADRILRLTNVDLDDRVEWRRAEAFFYAVLLAVEQRLPPEAREQLRLRGAQLPPESELAKARVALWGAVANDSMVRAPRSAAVRATLFAFSEHENERDGPLDELVYFCAYYHRAGLPEEPLVREFTRQWCDEKGSSDSSSSGCVVRGKE
jgi:hypothetical protein